MFASTRSGRRQVTVLVARRRRLAELPHDRRLLRSVRRPATWDPARGILIQGATVVTMDARHNVLPFASVLVRDGKIVASDRMLTRRCLPAATRSGIPAPTWPARYLTIAGHQSRRHARPGAAPTGQAPRPKHPPPRLGVTRSAGAGEFRLAYAPIRQAPQLPEVLPC